MSNTTIDTVDMTSFDREFQESEACQKCNPTTAREAEYMVRFVHITGTAQHVLAYCAIHLFLVIADADILVCATCSNQLEEVVYVRHWPIRSQEAASAKG